MSSFEFDGLADAIAAVANARNRILTDRLLSEIALNILILSRIGSARLNDRNRREPIDAACDDLVDLLRDAAHDNTTSASLSTP